jgi:hypothetical protein
VVVLVGVQVAPQHKHQWQVVWAVVLKLGQLLDNSVCFLSLLMDNHLMYALWLEIIQGKLSHGVQQQ